MKKCVLVLLTLLFMIYIFDNSSIMIEENVEVYVEKSTVIVYYYLHDEIKGASLETKASNIDEEIREVIKYLTANANAAPKGYISYLPLSSELIDYAIQGKKIILNFNHEFLKISNKRALTILKKNFCQLGFDDIELKVEGELYEN